MGKWLVVYSSVTGNTKRVAESIAAAAGEADLVSVEEVPEDLAGYEVVAAGYWLWRGGPAPKIAAWLPKVHDVPVVFFETHAAEPKSEHAITAFARAAYLLGSSCRVLATFGCQGAVSPAILAKRAAMAPDNPHARATGWKTAAGHPDAVDLAAAAEFVGKVKQKMVLIKKYGKN